MTKEEFVNDVLMHAGKQREEYPMLRYGQSIFNDIDLRYGIARTAQFEKGVDCFYDDTKVDEFLDTCYAIYSSMQSLNKK